MSRFDVTRRSSIVRRSSAERPGQADALEALIRACAALAPDLAVEPLLAALAGAGRALLGAQCALVIERDELGQLEIIARSGDSEDGVPPVLWEHVEQALAEGDPLHLSAELLLGDDFSTPDEDDDGRMGEWAAVPLPGAGREVVLAVARPSGPQGHVEVVDLELLTIFAAAAGPMLGRAQQRVELDAAVEREVALTEGIGAGLVLLGMDGTVQRVNDVASRFLRVERTAVVGNQLGILEDLAELYEAIDSERDELVLPHGRAELTARRFPGGTVVALQGMALEATARSGKFPARYHFEQILGEDLELTACVRNARRAAHSDVPILITGESGTGKELLAQAIHNESPRREHPFVAFNVTAIPRELLEGELFGHEAGAFTGARREGYAGKFEQAGRGTVLLDEIGDMPLEMQGKLLRVLQERVVQRLGGAREVPVRARILSTTHRDLERAIEDGKFRLDLYHRLCVVRLEVPSLRARKGDIGMLLQHFLDRHARARGRSPVKIHPVVLDDLLAYHWPGNIRELANVAEGWITLLPEGKHVIDRTPRKIRDHLLHSGQFPALMSGEFNTLELLGPGLGKTGEILPLSEVERRTIEHALSALGGNVSKVAKALGITRATVYAKMKKYGLGDG